MQPDPTPPDPTEAPPEESNAAYRDLLAELAELGMVLARTLTERAANPEPGAPDPIQSYIQLARSIRLTILLDQSLGQPEKTRRAPAHPIAHGGNVEARDDGRESEPAEVDRLITERPDRLESAERVETIGPLLATRSLDAIVARIRRDIVRVAANLATPNRERPGGGRRPATAAAPPPWWDRSGSDDDHPLKTVIRPAHQAIGPPACHEA